MEGKGIRSNLQTHSSINIVVYMHSATTAMKKDVSLFLDTPPSLPYWHLEGGHLQRYIVQPLPLLDYYSISCDHVMEKYSSFSIIYFEKLTVAFIILPATATSLFFWDLISLSFPLCFRSIVRVLQTR